MLLASFGTLDVYIDTPSLQKPRSCPSTITMTNTQEEESAKVSQLSLERTDNQEGTSSNDACKDESWDAAHLVDDSNQDPKVHGKYNSDDADVTIVSSDGVEFKVHSYRLQAAS